MEIRPVSLNSSKLLPIQIATSSNSTASTSASSKSTWRKFASDSSTYTYEEGSSDIFQVYEKLQWDLEFGNYEGAIKGLEIVLESHLPALNDLLRACLLSVKAKCHEELGQFDLALIDMEKAIDAYKRHETILDEVFENFNADIDPLSFLEMNKAGLLLISGKEEEGFAFLREHQPKNETVVLLYRLIEKEKGVSLLTPQSLVDENDLRSLFLAGRYEEVIEKTNTIETASSSLPFTYDPLQIRLRIAALAMTGRVEEAIQYYNEMGPDSSYMKSKEEIYVLLQALNGNKEYLDRDLELVEEFDGRCPIGLFSKWLLRL